MAIKGNCSSQINDQVSEVNHHLKKKKNDFAGRLFFCFFQLHSFIFLNVEMPTISEDGNLSQVGGEGGAGGGGRIRGDRPSSRGRRETTFPRQKRLIDMQSAARCRGWRHAEGANSRLSGCNHGAI